MYHAHYADTEMNLTVWVSWVSYLHLQCTSSASLVHKCAESKTDKINSIISETLASIKKSLQNVEQHIDGTIDKQRQEKIQKNMIQKFFCIVITSVFKVFF